MKHFFLCLGALFISVNLSFSQERVNDAPIELSYKSQEIKKALYWSKDRNTGKWNSRTNTKLVYLGEGVAVDNFNSIFIGKYNDISYLYIDYRAYKWRYPALEMEWSFYRTIMAAQISDVDYSRLQNISAGEIISIIPIFYNDMYKGHIEYSFPMFLSLTESLRKSADTLYKSYERQYGRQYADNYWKKEYPPINLLVAKRVIDNKGNDVVRFMLYPQAIPELIDSFYFEVEYSAYRNLFNEDKKKNYK